MQVASLDPVIITGDVAATVRFYTEHFGFQITFQADWYVSLRLPVPAPFELAILDPEHPTAPVGYRQPARGLILNFEADDVDAENDRLVRSGGLKAQLALRDEAFGQRHFIVADPNGVLIDIIKVIAPAAEYAERFSVSS